MKKLAVIVGIGLGLVASTLVAGALGGRPQTSMALDSLHVVARDGECVRFGYMSYVRGSANGTADPRSAVAKLGAADVGPGIDVAVAATPSLVEHPLADGSIVLEQLKGGSKVAAYRATEIDGGWVVTEYEYSGPCMLAH